ncbi:hypothetical protein [Streptomyces sp. NPDC016172]|uniref:hypothetical protein n=1 Tax=Streptomyces sp. NPDC016172 TaxID=3364964 RepID=UPI0036F7B254
MDDAKRSEVLGPLVLALAADPKNPPSEDEPTISSSRSNWDGGSALGCLAPQQR